MKAEGMMTSLGGFGGDAGLGTEGQRRETDTSRLFTPETLLPTQLPCSQEAIAVPAGVRGLMLAILEDAIYCLRDVKSPSAKARKEARQAEGWIRERGDTWVFSFDSICIALDLDVEDLRFRLLSAPPEEVVAQIGRRRRSHRVERGKRKRRAPNGSACAADGGSERAASTPRVYADVGRDDESPSGLCFVVAG